MREIPQILFRKLLPRRPVIALQHPVRLGMIGPDSDVRERDLPYELLEILRDELRSVAAHDLSLHHRRRHAAPLRRILDDEPHVRGPHNPSVPRSGCRHRAP